jgi:hypothetical protein
MAIDLTGINNENEFYAHHYLTAILEADIKDFISQWKFDNTEVKPPYAQLKFLSKTYFSFLSQFEKKKSIEDRIELQKEWDSQLLNALGYEYQAKQKNIDGVLELGLATEITKNNGAPNLWIIEVFNSYEDESDPLSLSLENFQANISDIKSQDELSLDSVITKHIFSLDEPPRWIIVLNHSQVILIDRSKWNEKRFLRFDIKEILGRKEDSTLKATIALLHRESISPQEGLALLDSLDENSHKHAFSVSEDLKYALREAIELIGNEAIYYLQEVRRKGTYTGSEKLDEKELTRECLRYMYRILFLLYIEARPELGYVPIRSDAYRSGYSLESLRDLELIKLTSEESKNGHYIHESIKLLFALIYEGVKSEKELLKSSGGYKTFEIPPLKTHLFDPERTPILNKVKFRNHILQRVIKLMSLSKAAKGKSKRRGRISYAQLGINQLGAVYEALLSYQGFFAQTDLYEVKKADEKYDELKNAYFIKAEDLEKYNEEEKVYNKDGSLKKYEKGSFIYRLAGRDREKSASYYTPEVLTKCLVKYSLKELLKDKTADDILKLKVCEPAMGSAAFLNEAINQLAEAYLERKQKELDERIAHDEYIHELQKVKMYLADNNVFGVDLNPVAVELAEVSLLLNTISRENFIPWFGMQLVCGNSLIGARRQVFDTKLLKREKKDGQLWLDSVPERVMPSNKREADTVYHFLLPDNGMADYKDKVIKELAGEEIKKINSWRKDFTKEFKSGEINSLKSISANIDKLWDEHTKLQAEMRERTTDYFRIWGQKNGKEHKNLSETRWKDKVLEQELHSKQIRNSSPYRRLKLAMDYWCSLWFWPIDQADLLPSRAEYLMELETILGGSPVEVSAGQDEQLGLFSETMSDENKEKLKGLGYADVNKLCTEVPRFKLVKELAEKHRFLHWELEFADIFNSNGGFDLLLGNPPWISISWKESHILSQYDPVIQLRNMKNISNREELLSLIERKVNYLNEYVESTSSRNFLTSTSYYPILKGTLNNLYKNFLVMCTSIVNSAGKAGLITDKSLYEDPTCNLLRKEIFPRLIYYFNFQNQLNLFAEEAIGHAGFFCMSIFSSEKKEKVNFDAIFNLFSPKTIDSSYEHTSLSSVPTLKRMKTKEWNLDGHSQRLIKIDNDYLKLMAAIFGENQDADSPCLISVYSNEIYKILEKLVLYPNHFRDFSSEFMHTSMFNETNAERKLYTKKTIDFVEELHHFVFSGPHFYVSTPWYKQPRRFCKSKGDYETIDLTRLQKDQIPRTFYQLNDSGISKIESFKNRKVTDYYRLVRRSMAGVSNERTLITAIIPPGPAHIHGVTSIVADNELLLQMAGVSHSIVSDFLIRSFGKTNISSDIVDTLPMFKKRNKWLNFRTLRLNCLSLFYSNLWQDCYDCDIVSDSFTKLDNRLKDWSGLTGTYSDNVPLRTFFERRQALIEIDVLVSLDLGITLNELITLYRTQFSVLYENENDTWYDQQGQIVFSCNKGLSGVGFTRPEWEKIKDMKEGTVSRTIVDDTLPGGPVKRTIEYHAPFDRCDRERDYEIAWKEFERRFQETK